MDTASLTYLNTMPSVDRFGNLPIEIAHLVYSNLSFKDLIRVSCVSKRWRELYFSNPYLNFHDFSDVDTSGSYQKEIVLNSIDTFFNQRGFGCEIQCFRFLWDNKHRDGQYNGDDKTLMSRLRRWIEIAVRCNVVALHVVITSTNRLPVFPASVFLCGSLKSLIVDMSCRIEVPPMDFSSNLECLELRHVSVQNDGFLKWISCCCNCIQELVLSDVLGLKSLVIENSSLRSFTFNSDYFDGKVRISGDRLEKLYTLWPVDTGNLSE